MTARDANLARIFEQIVSSAPTQRAELIAANSHDDPSLAHDLESLLDAHDTSEDFFRKLSRDVLTPAMMAAGLDETDHDPGLLGRLNEAVGAAYSIEREIGGGGMSRVFIATEVGLGRKVVIKTLPQAMSHEVSVERFRREIQVAAGLQNSHIVPVLTTGAADGFLYYVMPYVEGETLRSRLSRVGAMSVEEALAIWRDILDALGAAHAGGIVHRDIKPENVLLSGRNALVADFGISTAVEASTEGADVLGTPAYMAPEQTYEESTVDSRIDIYAAGLVMYEMLAGRSPFSGMSIGETMSAQRSLVPPALSREDVPLSIVSLVEQCIAKDPRARPASVENILAQLDSLKSGEIHMPRPPRSFARHRLAKTLGAIAGILLFLVLWKELGPRDGGRKTNPVGVAPSIAVLAFRNIGGDSTSEAMSEGISEEIAGTMGNIRGLSVRSPRSSFTLQSRKLTIQQIGSALRVRYLVDGSVQHVGPNLRVHVTLLSAANDSTLWTREYHRSFGDVFAMQDEIASDIAGELKVRLASGASVNLSRRTTASARAHELYLLGRFFFQRRDSSSLRKAGEYFAAAIAADSAYALAYAGLSDAYSHSSVFGYVPPRTSMPRARRYADRALALDNTLAEAHSSLAFVATFYEWDWPRAGREFERALALDSNYPSGHLWKAWYLIAKDSTEAGIAEGQLALSFEPFLVLTNTRLISLLYYGRRYDEALAQAQRTFEIDSTFFQLSTERARVLVELGRCTDALKEISHASPQTPAMLAGTRGYIYAKCGHRDDAQAELSRLIAESNSGTYVSHYSLAVIHAALGNKDAAFAELDRAVAERSWCMFLIKAEPAFDGLKSDPRFDKLAATIGI